MIMLVLSIVLMCVSRADAADNLLRNPGFEDGAGPVPSGWQINEDVEKKGSIEIVDIDGQPALALYPNRKNIDEEKERNPLGIGQLLNPRKDKRLQGATLHVSGRLKVDAAATAVVRIVAFRDGDFLGAKITHSDANSGFVQLATSLKLPDDNRTNWIVVAVDVHGTSGAAYFDDIYLGLSPRATAATPPPTRTASGARAASPRSSIRSPRAEIVINTSDMIRSIPKTLYDTNLEWGWDGE
ncbi:MAG: hypothetical protein AAF493_28145 [Pseudomonadota bacterium]